MALVPNTFISLNLWGMTVSHDHEQVIGPLTEEEKFSLSTSSSKFFENVFALGEKTGTLLLLLGVLWRRGS